jgi:hypothetical protein
MTDQALLLANQKGNFAIMLAVSLTFILALVSFVLDFSFFTREKNRYQAASEAAALAAVNTICFSTSEDLESLVHKVIRGFNLDLPDEAVTMELGFYDAYNRYNTTLGKYKDFASAQENPVPEGESVNAVLITIGEGQKVKSLTSMHKSREVLAAAVAYLPALGMASGGEIIFAGADKISLYNGSVYAGENIELRGYTLDLPQNHIRMAAGKTIKTFTRRINPFWGNINWTLNDTKPSPSLPEAALFPRHMISVSDLVSRLKTHADKIYTRADIGKGEFYHFAKQLTLSQGYFDFTGSHDRHEIIYIELPENWTAYLTPYPCCSDGGYGGHPTCINCTGDMKPNAKGACSIRVPFGTGMSNLTIAANCPVIIPGYLNRDNRVFDLGGEAFDQLNIVSLKEIKIHSHNNDLNGVNFICQDKFSINFTESKDYTPPSQNNIRIISESKINFTKNQSRDSDQYDFNLSFGMPCPPVFPPALGLLEPSAGE